jgi:hypothetical protein
VGSVASSKGMGMGADLIWSSDRDEGREDPPVEIIQTDLSAETPTNRSGPAWLKEPTSEIIVRGIPAEMLTAVLCTAATFVILRFGLELNRYVALGLAFASTIPWIYRSGGKIGVTLMMRLRASGHRREEDS